MVEDIRPRQAPELEVSSLFQEAVASHEAGDLTRAEALYRRILVLNARHFDALHLLGVVCHQTARQEEAADLLRKAIAIDPSQPAAHSNLGLVHQSLGDLESALGSFDSALSLAPRFVNALVNRGNVLNDLRRYEDALETYKKAGQLQPADAQLRFKQGLLQLELGRPAEALENFDGLLAENPRNTAVLCNRGNALLALKRAPEALESYDRALAVQPNLAEALNNRGDALRELGRPEEALATIDRALAVRPAFPDALTNRGITLRALDRYTDALASFDTALAHDPGHANALCNRGNVLQDLNRSEEALASYAMVLRNRPDHAESNWNEALCRLRTGDFRVGWPKYEWRWKTEQRDAVRQFSEPLWLGNSDISGRTILLHAEQGLGDTLLYCRYAKLVSALGANVILEVQKPLKSLLQTLQGPSRVIARGEPLPGFEFHCPLGSLPLAFDTTVESIPAFPSYLRCTPEALGDWRKKIGARTGPRIALAWSGNNAKRSFPLAEMLQLVHGGATFFSLQAEVSAADQALLDARSDVRQFSKGLRNFSDAPLLELMDLVITVDTSVAHVAGGLGKKVWILIGANADWRWLTGRGDSPWYPSARLFRAQLPGRWDGVIEKVRAALDLETFPSPV
jgi:tetratricopeptide (TPR) repeat protein